MSLDNIQLPAFIHQSIFKNKLVSSNANSEKELITNNVKIDFLGGNKKKIIFVAKETQNKFLTDQDLSFLEGLLAACKLTLDDIGFINIVQNKPIDYREITTQLKATKLLVFGVSADALDLPFQIPFFQIQNFQEQQYMLSPSFEKLKSDANLKKQLWVCLQKIFNIQK